MIQYAARRAYPLNIGRKFNLTFDDRHINNVKEIRVSFFFQSKLVGNKFYSNEFLKHLGILRQS
jgi:hypothetical protein